MLTERIRSILKEGEGLKVEFKKCKNSINKDVFKIIIPLTEQVTEQVTEQAERVEKILNYCKEPKTTSEIMTYLELTHREHFRSMILNPLIEKGLLFLTIPDKPNSPKQKYYSNNTVEILK
ncbi:MAG: Fic family protein [bacterium]